jgi:hypothetical protein
MNAGMMPCRVTPSTTTLPIGMPAKTPASTADMIIAITMLNLNKHSVVITITEMTTGNIDPSINSP